MAWRETESTGLVGPSGSRTYTYFVDADDGARYSDVKKERSG